MTTSTGGTTQLSGTTPSIQWVNRFSHDITKVEGWRVRNVQPYDRIISDEHFVADVLIVANSRVLLWQPIIWICRTDASFNTIYGLDRFGKHTGEQLKDAILAAVMTYQYSSKECAS